MPAKRARGRPRTKVTEDGDDSDEDYGKRSKPSAAKTGGGRPGRPKRQAAPKNGNCNFFADVFIYLFFLNSENSRF